MTTGQGVIPRWTWAWPGTAVLVQLHLLGAWCCLTSLTQNQDQWLPKHGPASLSEDRCWEDLQKHELGSRSFFLQELPVGAVSGPVGEATIYDAVVLCWNAGVNPSCTSNPAPCEPRGKAAGGGSSPGLPAITAETPWSPRLLDSFSPAPAWQSSGESNSR